MNAPASSANQVDQPVRGARNVAQSGGQGSARPADADRSRFSFNPSEAPRRGISLRRRFIAAMRVLSILWAVAVIQVRALTLDLAATIEVDSAGLLVADVVPAFAAEPAGALKLADAPAFGETASLTRETVIGLLKSRLPDLAVTNWTGAQTVKISRRSRLLTESEVQQWLVDSLQAGQVRDRGELELRITRSWRPTPVPDEAFELRLVDMPLTGIAPSFVARVAVECAGHRVATVQVPAQARIWKDVLVAAAPLLRGQSLDSASVRPERRDVLSIRDYLTAEHVAGADYELVSNVMMGQLVSGRALRIRPAVTRGTVVDGLVNDGAMTISMKVEVLEDAAIGQNLRVRNVKTRREMLGKVQNEQTIVLYL